MHCHHQNDGLAQIGKHPLPVAHSRDQRRRRTALRVAVSLPVSSTHSTVVAPSSSTAGIPPASTVSHAGRHPPRPRNNISTTGSSSGRIGIAGINPTIGPCNQSPVLTPYAKARETASRRQAATIRSRQTLKLIAAAGNACYLPRFAGIFGLDMQDIAAQQTGMTKDAFKARLVAAGQ